MDAEEERNLRWEYKALNLKKVIGPGLENAFNKLGAEGWQFVNEAKDYAVFRRPLP